MSTESLNEVAKRNQKKMQASLSKYASLAPDTKKGGITWDVASAEYVLEAIVNVTGDGCALTFGKTSDGGALVMVVLENKQTYKLYSSSVAELNENFGKLADLASNEKSA